MTLCEMDQNHVGINYPWMDYGWDFGDPPRVWLGGRSIEDWRASKREQMVRHFSDFAALGIFAVRWFLLGDGLNYGMGAEAPRLVRGKWVFEPLRKEHPQHERILQDFDFVLQTCARLKLKLVPSLVDFHWCFPGRAAAPDAGIIKGGRADVVVDPAKRKTFLDHVLEPLLAISTKYTDAIYAWEVMNEPEHCTQQQGPWKRLWNLNPRRIVPLQAMRDFIAEGVSRINSHRQADGSPAFLSTIGFEHRHTAGRWNCDSLGISLPQFHYYPKHNDRLPHNRQARCFIGEVATTSGLGLTWPDLQEAGKEQAITNRLQWIAERGYESAFLWSAHGKDRATIWTEAEKQETAAFARRSQA